MAELAGPLLIGIVPVLVFLAALIYLDSYKLVRLRRVMATIAVGGLVAGACYGINVGLLSLLSLEVRILGRYVAPLVEEIGKALLLVYFIRSHRVGFLVDAAIYGFAVGTGFAIVENIYYLQFLPDAHLAVWLVRGFGTAVMHGGTTAIFAVSGRALADRPDIPAPLAFLPGFLMAVAIHSGFNHFLWTPVLSTIGILIVLPPLIAAVFRRSEASLQDWLRLGFDAHTELLDLIHSGGLSRSRVGLYLGELKERFPGEVVGDMLCYLKLHTELALTAKGLLMMREQGFRVALDDETRAKFAELKYLEGTIGVTGRLAMAPFLHVAGKEVWQLYLLGR